MNMTKRSLLALLTIGIALLVTPMAIAQTGSATPTNLEYGKAGKFVQEFPHNIFGMVEIERVRETNLLHLRGIAGRGETTLKSIDEQGCVAIPIRFIAGDFKGRNVSAHISGSIRIAILSQKIARTLTDGQDIVSEKYRVSSDPNDTDADILILGGLSADTGFVLNPGRTFFADIFGVRVKKISCIDEQN